MFAVLILYNHLFMFQCWGKHLTLMEDDALFEIQVTHTRTKEEDLNHGSKSKSYLPVAEQLWYFAGYTRSIIRSRIKEIDFFS